MPIIRPIVTLPDPILRRISTPIGQVDNALRGLAQNMLATMYEAQGIGLAAVQIGEPIRLVVTDVSKEGNPPAPFICINPEIIWESQERSVYAEGCLSIPDIKDDVERPTSIRIRYVDLEGMMQEMQAEGLFAICLQHEIDHLNGILFIDYLSRLKRSRILKKFVKKNHLSKISHA